MFIIESIQGYSVFLYSTVHCTWFDYPYKLLSLFAICKQFNFARNVYYKSIVFIYSHICGMQGQVKVKHKIVLSDLACPVYYNY